jgi:hypothetical protein
MGLLDCAVRRRDRDPPKVRPAAASPRSALACEALWACHGALMWGMTFVTALFFVRNEGRIPGLLPQGVAHGKACLPSWSTLSPLKDQS